MLDLLHVIEVFPGKETALIQQKSIITSGSEVSLHNTDFFHLRLILSLFWALISCVSSARPFPTLHLSSIIHNPQLFLPSHNTTYLQTIIFLF